MQEIQKKEIPVKIYHQDNIQRLSTFPKSYKDLTESIEKKYEKKLPEFWALQYLDPDGDFMVLSDENDYKEMCKFKGESLKIYIIDLKAPVLQKAVSSTPGADSSFYGHDLKQSVLKSQVITPRKQSDAEMSHIEKDFVEKKLQKMLLKTKIKKYLKIIHDDSCSEVQRKKYIEKLNNIASGYSDEEKRKWSLKITKIEDKITLKQKLKKMNDTKYILKEIDKRFDIVTQEINKQLDEKLTVFDKKIQILEQKEPLQIESESKECKDNIKSLLLQLKSNFLLLNPQTQALINKHLGSVPEKIFKDVYPAENPFLVTEESSSPLQKKSPMKKDSTSVQATFEVLNKEISLKFDPKENAYVYNISIQNTSNMEWSKAMVESIGDNKHPQVQGILGEVKPGSSKDTSIIVKDRLEIGVYTIGFQLIATVEGKRTQIGDPFYLRLELQNGELEKRVKAENENITKEIAPEAQTKIAKELASIFPNRTFAELLKIVKDNPLLDADKLVDLILSLK